MSEWVIWSILNSLNRAVTERTSPRETFSHEDFLLKAKNTHWHNWKHPNHCSGQASQPWIATRLKTGQSCSETDRNCSNAKINKPYPKIFRTKTFVFSVSEYEDVPHRICLFSPGVCDVDLKNKTGYTAVMLACLQPLDTDMDIKVVQQLMELGDVNTRAGQVSNREVLAHWCTEDTNLLLYKVRSQCSVQNRVRVSPGPTPAIKPTM